MRGAAAQALGVLGDPSAAMPLYEVASDPATEAWLRRIARRSLEHLGFERREGDGPPAILAWLAGVVVMGGSLLLATVVGPVAIVGLLAGAAIILAYYVRESRKAREGEWYVGEDGGEYWFPADAHVETGGWLSDIFGGGGGGGGGNGGS